MQVWIVLSSVPADLENTEELINISRVFANEKDADDFVKRQRENSDHYASYEKQGPFEVE